jgi:DNA-binding MarR family transcriptional regulator
MASRKGVKKAKAAVNGRDGMALAVLGQFRTVFKSVRRHYQRVQKQSHVSGAQLWALSHIARSPGGTVGELARSLAIHQSTASNLLNLLVKRQLVSRERERSDQRVVRLGVTAKGKKALGNAPRPLTGVLQHALGQMPQRSLQALHDDLHVLIRTMHVRDKTAKSTPLSEM